MEIIVDNFAGNYTRAAGQPSCEVRASEANLPELCGKREKVTA